MAISSIEAGFSSAPALAAHAASGAAEGGAAPATAQIGSASGDASAVTLSRVVDGAAATYNSAGLLSDPAHAKQSSADNMLAAQVAANAPQKVMRDAIDKQVVADLSAKAVLSGVYNGVGALEFAPFARVADLGSLLRANPELSSIIVGNSYNQGEIEALNIIA